MNSHKEKRKHDRMEFDTRISYSGENDKDHHQAFMHNFGTDGMGFESDVPIKKGTILHVKAHHYRSNISSCTVKWCRKKEGSDKYEIGMEFEIHD